MAQRSPQRGEGPLLIAAILGLAFGMNVVARGVSETFAVFLLPVQDTFGWTRSEMTGVYSVYMLVHGLFAPVAGILFDRFGARFLYGLGLLALGGGFYLAGSVTTLWQYYACVGVLGGIGVAATGMVPASGLLSRWFTNRLGTVMGLAYAALGVGVLVLLPLTQLLLERYPWRRVYEMLGGGVLIVLLLVMLLPLGRMTAGARAWREARDRPGGGGVRWTIRTAVRTPAFWGLFNVFFFTALAAYAVLPQSVAYLVEQGFDPLTAASAFGLTGMLSVVGMANMGWLSDRFGRRLTVSISYALTIAGIICLILVAWYPSLLLVYGFVIFFGINQGARGPIVSTLTAFLFAGGGIGGIYGAITMGLGLGAAIGSWASGALHDWTGGYVASFLLGASGAVVGLLQFWVVKSLSAR